MKPSHEVPIGHGVRSCCMSTCLRADNARAGEETRITCEVCSHRWINDKDVWRCDVHSCQEAATRSWWWLSFADAEGFRGVCIVLGADVLRAAEQAWAVGCNPGGHIQGYEIDSEDLKKIPLSARNRLLTRDELHAFKLI